MSAVRKAKRSRTPKRSGHPARTHETRSYKRRQYFKPTAEEQEIRAKLRTLLREGDEDGLVAGPLLVAAEHAARMLASAHQLDGDEHQQALAQWVYGVCGELLNGFHPETPPAVSIANLPGYSEWRDRSKERASESA